MIKKTVLVICYLAMFIMLCSCSKSEENITENITDKSIVIDYHLLNTMKEYELDITSKEVLDVAIICETGELSLEVYNENDEKLYTGRIETSTNFEVFCKGEKAYIKVKGKETTGSLEMNSVTL